MSNKMVENDHAGNYLKIYICRIVHLCRGPDPEMTPEERDARTVFCMQLSARIRPRDLEEFFSSVGKVSWIQLLNAEL